MSDYYRECGYDFKSQKALSQIQVDTERSKGDRRKNRKIIFRIIAVTMMTIGCSYTTQHVDKAEAAMSQGKVQNILSDALIKINAINENRESSQEQPALTTQIVSDFLQMDSEEFQNKYDKNELYIQNILYCSIDDWKYHGMQLDAFQNKEDYYDVIDISAIRFRDWTEEMNVFGKYGRESIKSNRLYVKVRGDFAISIYKPEGTGNQERGSESKMAEISFVKINLREGTAPEELYSFLENDYYKVREEIQEEQWVQSPDGTRAACVSNGSLPKHPAQIFIRYAEEVPDDVFRRTWECRIVGWIDEEHLVCYDLDRYPILISLEKKQVEIIKKEEDDYDAYGAEYIIDGNSLVCKVLGEEVYQWKIVREENEVKFVGDSEKILDGQEQNDIADFVKLESEVEFNDFMDQSPDLIMDRVMEEKDEGYVRYRFNSREFGGSTIENRIGTLNAAFFDGIAYHIYMYEYITDGITGESHTAITEDYHIFIKDKLVISE